MISKQFRARMMNRGKRRSQKMPDNITDFYTGTARSDQVTVRYWDGKAWLEVPFLSCADPVTYTISLGDSEPGPGTLPEPGKMM